ncbi:MAG TPA: DUF6798 domain-containing protein [Bryobacteraceae bacterium]|nr:DUF6798 domain-containing protein [Bryobacteraceae bacterium]
MGETATREDTRPIALRSLALAAVVALLAALSIAFFPGHSLLASDTQIYLPILEHLRDPSVLAGDPVAQRPHVSFTVYDEVALALRGAGIDFETALLAQQFVFRALGILGVWLVASSMGLGFGMATVTAAVFSLGAVIGGPTVLTVEYEPVPRGFAIPLLVLAMGCAAHGRDLLAGAAASVAFLYHPPSAVTFWGVYFLLSLWPSSVKVMSRRVLGLAPLLAGVLVMLVLSRMQGGVSEVQPFFGRIDPELERLQRLRGSYNWISTWGAMWAPQYVFLWAASLFAYWRVRRDAVQDLRFFLIGLPALGIASMPLSWLLLEKLKWVVAPQVQPARALLFVTLIAGVLACVVGAKTAAKGRWWEAGLWFVLAYAIPTQSRLFDVIESPGAIALVVGLAALATFAAWAEARKLHWAMAGAAAAALLPFLLVPLLPEAPRAPNPHTPELDALSRWARESTPVDSMFLFPDAGKTLAPGIFRARALRAVYVDWKGGGQVNFLRRFAQEWWERWQRTGAGRFKPWHVPAYGRWGIDYFVLKRGVLVPGFTPVYANGGYAVYATTAPGNLMAP